MPHSAINGLGFVFVPAKGYPGALFSSYHGAVQVQHSEITAPHAVPSDSSVAGKLILHVVDDSHARLLVRVDSLNQLFLVFLR
jgi:hypothetical protein